jgi:hypothetical protein
MSLYNSSFKMALASLQTCLTGLLKYHTDYDYTHQQTYGCIALLKLILIKNLGVRTSHLVTLLKKTTVTNFHTYIKKSDYLRKCCHKCEATCHVRTCCFAVE